MSLQQQRKRMASLRDAAGAGRHQRSVTGLAHGVDQMPPLWGWLGGEERVPSALVFPSQLGALPLNSWWHSSDYRTENKVNSKLWSPVGSVPHDWDSSIMLLGRRAGPGPGLWGVPGVVTVTTAGACGRDVVNRLKAARVWQLHFQLRPHSSTAPPAGLLLKFKMIWFYVNTWRNLCVIQVRFLGPISDHILIIWKISLSFKNRCVKSETWMGVPHVCSVLCLLRAFVIISFLESSPSLHTPPPRISSSAMFQLVCSCTRGSHLSLSLNGALC